MDEFNDFVVADGRHFKLFSDMQDGEITQQEFEEQENKLLTILTEEYAASKCKNHGCCRN